MKTSVLLLLTLGTIFLIVCFSFNKKDVHIQKCQQRQGIYIYVISKPEINDYKVIGVVGKINFDTNWNGSAEEKILKIIQVVKKRFPTVNAICFDSFDLQTCEIIQFK